MTVTVTLKKVACGTALNMEQAGESAVIPAEMCYLGWQESLIQLAMLVELEIPNESLLGWGCYGPAFYLWPRGRRSAIVPGP